MFGHRFDSGHLHRLIIETLVNLVAEEGPKKRGSYKKTTGLAEN